jgi:hypothetical protein
VESKFDFELRIQEGDIAFLLDTTVLDVSRRRRPVRTSSAEIVERARGRPAAAQFGMAYARRLRVLELR